MNKNQNTIRSSDESNGEKMSQKTLVNELESMFRLDTPLIKSTKIDGVEFISIVYAEKVSKGFGMISISGHRLQRIIPMIEGAYHLNSINTTYHKGTMQTKILIVEDKE